MEFLTLIQELLSYPQRVVMGPMLFGIILLAIAIVSGGCSTLDANDDECYYVNVLGQRVDQFTDTNQQIWEVCPEE